MVKRMTFFQAKVDRLVKGARVDRFIAALRAARQFMLDNGADANGADEFAAEATAQMPVYYLLPERVVHGNGASTDHGHFAMAVGMMPDYWEPAELSLEFRAELSAA